MKMALKSFYSLLNKMGEILIEDIIVPNAAKIFVKYKYCILNYILMNRKKKVNLLEWDGVRRFFLKGDVCMHKPSSYIRY